MDFELSDDQRLLKDSARNFLAAEWPVTKVRELLEHATGFDTALWQHMGALGWLGLRVPEAFGGSGLSLTDLASLTEEFGWALVPEPFVASAVTAVALLRHANHAWSQQLLPGMASGSTVVVPALLDPAVEHAVGEAPTRAVRQGDQYRIAGRKLFVPHADVADHLIVSADVVPGDGTAGGIGLFVVPRTTAGIALTPLYTVDATWWLFEVTLDTVCVESTALLAPLDTTASLLESARRETCLVRSAEATGVAAHTLELATAYARERSAFGHPIGSYQAVQHKLVDMLVAVENARSLVYYAAWALDDKNAEAAQAVAMAKAYSTDVAWDVTTNAIQVYGGIGFTWECDLHLYHRRALQLHASDGTPAEHREDIARLLIGA